MNDEVDRYDRDRVYKIGDRVKASNGRTYVSSKDDNSANVPLDNSVFWIKEV